MRDWLIRSTFREWTNGGALDTHDRDDLGLEHEFRRRSKATKHKLEQLPKKDYHTLLGGCQATVSRPR